MEPTRNFVITDSLNVVLKNVQLDTKIVIMNNNNKEFITLDVDKWTQFKQNVEAIDKEFHRRFNYQYCNL